MNKAYSSNLTQAQWELLEPLIPAAKPFESAAPQFIPLLPV